MRSTSHAAFPSNEEVVAHKFRNGFYNGGVFSHDRRAWSCETFESEIRSVTIKLEFFSPCTYYIMLHQLIWHGAYLIKWECRSNQNIFLQSRSRIARVLNLLRFIFDPATLSPALISEIFIVSSAEKKINNIVDAREAPRLPGLPL